MIKFFGSGHWPIFILGSFSSMANLYLPVFLSRALSPEEMGVYKIFFLHLGAIPFLFLAGGPLHSVYYWAGRDEKQRSRYIQQAFALALGLSLLIPLAGLPMTGAISSLTSLSDGHVALMLLSAFFMVPAEYYPQTKIALGFPLKGSMYDALFEFFKVACFVWIASESKDLGHIFLAFCLIFGLKFFVSLYLKFREGILRFDPGLDKIREIFRYCLPISLAGLVTFFVDKLDQFVLAAFLPAEKFAYYSMGCLMIPPLYLLETSVTSVLVPKLAKAWNKDEKEALTHFQKAVGDSAFLLIPSFFGLIVFAKPIITLLYTDKFIEAVDYFQIFAFTYLILIIPYDAVPRATGKTKWIFNLTLGAGLLSLAAVLFAASALGAVETLCAALFFKACARLLGLGYSARIMGWSLAEIFPWKRLCQYTAVAGTLSVASLALKNSFGSQGLWFLACSPVFAAVYLAVFASSLKASFRQKS